MATRWRPVLSFMIPALCGAAFIAGAGGRGAGGGAPVSLAVVDVKGVLENLNEFKDRNAEFRARGEAHTRAMNDMQERARQIETELRTTIDPRDIKRRAEKMGELSELRVNIKARDEIFAKRLEIEQGEVVHGLYAKLIATVGALARREGYDLVLADDRATMTQPGAPIGENLARIDARTVLFAADHLSLTDRVVAVMNNDYAAGQAPAAGQP
jgi:Skp family chaperone for outer membrane proteins